MTDSRARRRPPPVCPSRTRRLSQVFGERSAGEEVQDGTHRSLLLLSCPCSLGRSLLLAAGSLVVLRSAAWWEASDREWVLFVCGLAVPCRARAPATLAEPAALTAADPLSALARPPPLAALASLAAAAAPELRRRPEGPRRLRTGAPRRRRISTANRYSTAAGRSLHGGGGPPRRRSGPPRRQHDGSTAARNLHGSEAPRQRQGHTSMVAASSEL